MDSEPGGMTCDNDDVDKMEASIELTEEEQREERIPVPQVRSVPSPSVRTPPSGNPYKHHSNISHILLPWYLAVTGSVPLIILYEPTASAIIQSLTSSFQLERDAEEDGARAHTHTNTTTHRASPVGHLPYTPSNRRKGRSCSIL